MAPTRPGRTTPPGEPATPEKASAGTPLDAFSPPARDWFRATFRAPTPAQEDAWTAIRHDAHVLVVAPTGEGKTLAAFLWAIDRLMSARTAGPPSAADLPAVPEATEERTDRILYISPLKALAADIEKNLREPLAGIRSEALSHGQTLPEVSVGMRTGDTSTGDRRRLTTSPPDILITTPESLFLMLTSQARRGLAGIGTVIVDEIHAVAGTKRGAHLALSLERLDTLLGTPAQRIGLSATVRPISVVTELLTGHSSGREVVVTQPRSYKRLRVDVEVPVPDLTDLPETAPGVDEIKAKRSIWPHLEERIVDLIAAHGPTIVFTNSRRTAERLTARLNESWARRTGLDVLDPGGTDPAEMMAQSGASSGSEPMFARAHHGSMSRQQRLETEAALKAGSLPAVVATSSLELGIDMGAVDLVIQLGSPPSVASGLQRVGRAGHRTDALSHGIILPMFRGDLIPATVSAVRMRSGQIEEVHLVRNPLDVLAQQIVAMVAVDDWPREELGRLVRAAAPFRSLPDDALEAVLDMLSGRFPSDRFGSLRARITWDRIDDVLRARPGSKRLAVTSGGTIPDRGAYGVFLPESAGTGPKGGRRVGELDEEMVYESRVGDVFTLGSSAWRITAITPDQVQVVPAPGVPGRLPFWKGDSPARPAELGTAIGTWVRELSILDEAGATERLAADGLDPWAVANLLDYLREQRAATGVVPDDRTIIVERFRDEVGDWRIAILSPFGRAVHAPWALVLAARLRARLGIDVSVMNADDGIVLRLPDADGESSGAFAAERPGPRLTVDDLLLDPAEVRTAVQEELSGSALFAARFRESASRALLLPRNMPGKRQPLWQQRHRSAQLLDVAKSFPQFPIMLEAIRECLQEDFDVSALTEVMSGLSSGRIRLLEVDTPSASPFAHSLLFDYTGQFLYDDDAPLGERAIAALSLDTSLLDQILEGDQFSVATLLDPDSVQIVELELGRLNPARGVRHSEDVLDLLRELGPLTLEDIRRRTPADLKQQALGWLGTLMAAGLVFEVSLGQERLWAAAEDASRLRDGLGVVLPEGLPPALCAPVPDPLGDLILRHARTHGPFPPEQVANRFNLPLAVIQEVLERLRSEQLLVAGALRPKELGGTGLEFCDRDVLRTLRRRSLAVLRSRIEAVPGQTLGLFLPRWQNVGRLTGVDGVRRVVEQLAGLPIPVSELERTILPARVRDYSPSMLDQLTTSGEVLWVGHGQALERPADRGNTLISLHPAATAPVTVPDPSEQVLSPLAESIRGVLRGGGAFFAPQILSRLDAHDSAETTSDEAPSSTVQAGTVPVESFSEALWELVWAGCVTNDSFAPLRSLVGHRGAARPSRGTTSRGRPRRLSRYGFEPMARAAAESGTRPSIGLPDQASLQALPGRWSLLSQPEQDPTLRTYETAEQLLDRYGIVTRAVGSVEALDGRLPEVMRVLGGLERSGRARRGFFVEGLGGSQFADLRAVDVLRSDVQEFSSEGSSPEADAPNSQEHASRRTRPQEENLFVLSSCDPANPYGVLLPWPTLGSPAQAEPDVGADAVDPPPPATAGQTDNRLPLGGSGHRPGRIPGSTVVLVEGPLALFLERGGRTLLTFTYDERVLAAAARALAREVPDGRLGRVSIERVDGDDVLLVDSPAIRALLGAGFTRTPRGLRHRDA